MVIGEPFGEPSVRKARDGEPPVRKARAGEPFGEPAIPEPCAGGTSAEPAFPEACAGETSGEPPVRKARAGEPPVWTACAGSTFSMVGGGRLAFTPKAPANIIRRSDLEGSFWATFVIGGDDGDSSV